MAEKSTNSAYNPNSETNLLMSDQITGLDTTPGSKYSITCANSIITITYVNNESDTHLSGTINISDYSTGGEITGVGENTSGGGGNTPTPGIYDAETGELLIPWPELVEEIGTGSSGTAYRLSSGLGVGVKDNVITRVWDASHGLPTGYGGQFSPRAVESLEDCFENNYVLIVPNGITGLAESCIAGRNKLVGIYIPSSCIHFRDVIWQGACDGVNGDFIGWYLPDDYRVYFARDYDFSKISNFEDEPLDRMGFYF